MHVEENSNYMTVILPVFHNSSQLWELISRLDPQFELIGIDGEILLIDDGSGPEAWDEIRRICDAFPRAKGIRFSRNFGQHAAIRAGLEVGDGSIFVLMDADLENRPEDIRTLYESLNRTGFQIVLGKWGNSRPTKFFSGLFHRLVAQGNYDPVTIMNSSSMRIFTRLIRDELLKYQEHDAVFGPILHRLGFPMGQVAIERDSERAPESRYSFRSRWKLARAELVTLVARFALRAIVGVGLGSVMAALAIAIFTVVRFWTAGGDLMSTNSLYGFVVALLVGYASLSISVLIFLIKNLLLQSHRRPPYHIAEVIR